MSAIPTHGPEERWRRTVDQRGRPLKLKVGRLLKEFGYARLEPGVGEAIESRLAQVGLQVRPGLRDATADQVILLEVSGAGAAAPPDAPAADPAPASIPGPGPAARPSSPAPELAFDRPATRPTQRPAEHAFDRPAERLFERAPEPALAPAAVPAPRLDPGDEMEQSLLVRAAVEAERRVRNAYDRAASAAAERIGGLERELAAEREATARARDERDELERRMHVERREAAARLQALSAAERTARGLLEAQRTELSNLTQTVRVTTAAIAQTRETLGDVHEQVQQTAADVRDALVEHALPDDDTPPPQVQRYEPPAYVEPAPDRHEEGLASQQVAVRPHPHERQDEPEPAGDTAIFAPIAEREPPQQRAFEELDDPAPPAPDDEVKQLGRKGGRKARGRAARLRKRASIVCAVCGRPGKARDPAELVDAGWRVEGEVALCLTCVADDWKLAEGSTVPFRAHG